ncbi:hypothetical protein GS399_03280 [Pedobacter sp. HMF7647]|uniref:Asl1-like glycosyl hydrolase catalytic domain-containing protein n=1 Tax=Hufsiella arboris TaxID=2695275 RepID=A0A7K1Y6E1_9SPHI|nr:glycosyl hydrolase [Hufsiella arboris]MXV49981.1 hypothetical protein [Hufsiella arboris]
MFKYSYLQKTVIISLVAVSIFTQSCKKGEIISTPTLSDQNKLSAAALESTSTSPILAGSSLQLGINGHPLDGTGAYSYLTAAKQVELLKSMGMTWYRVDVTTMSDGSITVPYLYNPLKEAAIAGKVNILPVLYTRTLNMSATESASYEAGKKIGGNFAAKYGAYFNYYELGNELDLKILLAGKSGQSQSHYDTAKFKIIAAYLKGMDVGIKEMDPGAKTMVDASWLHYAFFWLLDNYGVKYDIIAYHWYSEMESAAAGTTYKIDDITKKLSGTFSKPIWFTEFGQRFKNNGVDEENQQKFITSFLEKCKKNPRVQVVMGYELLDEPQKNSLLESNYGFLKWQAYPNSWSKKLVAETLTIK